MRILLIPFLLIFLNNCAAFTSISTGSQSSDSVSTSFNTISKSLDSVSSISKSLSSISKSSSKEKKEEEAKYQKEVRMITYISLKDSRNDFSQLLNTVSMNNGILDWRLEKSTFLGIGEGFAKAKVSQKEFDSFLKNEIKDNSVHSLIYEGYRNWEL
jgi:hypothetical protein